MQQQCIATAIRLDKYIWPLLCSKSRREEKGTFSFFGGQRSGCRSPLLGLDRKWIQKRNLILLSLFLSFRQETMLQERSPSLSVSKSLELVNSHLFVKSSCVCNNMEGRTPLEYHRMDHRSHFIYLPILNKDQITMLNWYSTQY